MACNSAAKPQRSLQSPGKLRSAGLLCSPRVATGSVSDLEAAGHLRDLYLHEIETALILISSWARSNFGLRNA